MKKIVLCVVLALGAALSAGAQSLDFGLVNKTGHVITTVCIAAAGEEDWLDNFLLVESLAKGETATVSPDMLAEAVLLGFDVDLYDLLVETADKLTWIVPGLKLETIALLELSLDKKGTPQVHVKKVK